MHISLYLCCSGKIVLILLYSAECYGCACRKYHIHCSTRWCESVIDNGIYWSGLNLDGCCERCQFSIGNIWVDVFDIWLDVSFLYLFGPCATSPLAPLSDLLPLVGSSVLCFSVGVSAFDFAVVFSLAFVCRLWCCGASCLLFLLCCGRLPSPLAVVSLPFDCSLAASWSSYCAGPSLWVSGCFMWRPGCLALMLGCCGALFPRFILLHGSKGIWPCVVLCYPLHHGACVVVVLCTPALRYSS